MVVYKHTSNTMQERLWYVHPVFTQCLCTPLYIILGLWTMSMLHYTKELCVHAILGTTSTSHHLFMFHCRAVTNGCHLLRPACLNDVWFPILYMNMDIAHSTVCCICCSPLLNVSSSCLWCQPLSADSVTSRLLTCCIWWTDWFWFYKQEKTWVGALVMLTPCTAMISGVLLSSSVLTQLTSAPWARASAMSGRLRAYDAQ